jgi:hypothetical protein
MNRVMAIKRTILTTLLVLLVSSCALSAQPVAEAARAAREKQKSSTRRVITNEDLEPKTAVSRSSWDWDLERIRGVLRSICAAPSTSNGRNLSEADKQSLEDAVKPLRVRRMAMEAKLKHWKAAYKELDKEEEKALIAATSKMTSFTEQDRNRIVAIRGEFESRRSLMKTLAQSDVAAYERMKEELTSTAAECQAAADAVK